MVVGHLILSLRSRRGNPCFSLVRTVSILIQVTISIGLRSHGLVKIIQKLPFGSLSPSFFIPLVEMLRIKVNDI